MNNLDINRRFTNEYIEAIIEHSKTDMNKPFRFGGKIGSMLSCYAYDLYRDDDITFDTLYKSVLSDNGDDLLLEFADRFSRQYTLEVKYVLAIEALQSDSIDLDKLRDTDSIENWCDIILRMAQAYLYLLPGMDDVDVEHQEIVLDVLVWLLGVHTNK